MTAVKGKKGFQPIPERKKQSKRVVFYITESQNKTLEAFCKKKDITPSSLIKERLNDIIGNA